LLFNVDGGPASTRDRLAVIDDGLDDLSIYRKGASDATGSITVGPANAEPFDFVFENVEYTEILDEWNQPVTQANNNGRVVVFKHDPFEANNDILVATHLGAGAALNVDPTIDPGAFSVGPPFDFVLPADEDWYRVEAEVTGTLDFQVFFEQIALVASSGRPGLPGAGDLELQLFDADGTLIVSGAPGGFGTNDADADERIRIPAVQGQVYYLRVFGATGAVVNNYTLSVLNQAPPTPFDLELADNLVILTGSQEAPPIGPVSTIANGTANFQYHAATNTFDLDLFVSGVELVDLTSLPELTGAHIHSGAVGVNGPIIVNLGVAGWTVEPAGIRLRLTGAAFSAAPADIAALLAGDTYINIHTTANPLGAIRGQIHIQEALGVSDSGRSQFDDVTRDNTPTILLRLDDAILLNDLPGNAAGVPGAPPPDEVIPIPFNPSTAASPVDLAPGFRVAVYDETDTHNPVFLGFAQPVANLNGVYSFTFATPLVDGSHFISARVQMIDPADNDLSQVTVTPATGFGPRSQSLEIVVDTVPPPVFFGVASDPLDGLVPDPGVTPQPPTAIDRKTNDTTPEFWGTAEANAIIRVYADLTPENGIDNFDVLLGLTVAQPEDGTNQYPNGQWRVSSTVDLNDPAFFPLDGLRRILVTAEDLAGNVSPGAGLSAEALNIFLDTQGPQVFGVFFPRDTMLVGLGAGNTLVRFRASAPGTILATVPITGLAAGETVVGIDVRPVNGLLYGVVDGPVTDRLVTIDPFLGTTTPVANLTAALLGTSFGVDFNPVVDRLRVVSDLDQNLRIDPDTGVVTVDAALNPPDPNVVAAAYTNSTLGAESTGLYVIDSNADVLALQNPASAGTLTTIGPLGVDASAVAGFDITPELNVAYAALTVGGTTSLYTIDLATGAATLVGAVGGNPSLAGLAALPPYDVFDPKPSTDGPTPLVHSLTVRVQDFPARVLEFPNPALNPEVAVAPGHFLLVGDANGIIPIQSVAFLPDPTVPGQAATGTIVLTFFEPLPDDRFTLTLRDALVDDAGNRLDGESNAPEPQEQPLFPSGDGQPGGDFVARFTVDTRPEIGVWDAGSVYVDTNGNFHFDPTNLDFTNRDLIYTLGFTADDLFAGNFAGPGPDNVYGTADDDLADGFDKLAAYGRVGGQWRWLIDTDNDGVANLVTSGPEPTSLNAVPFAGNFDGNAQNGDEIGLFTGTAWFFDTNHDFRIDLASRVNTAITGYPVVGDFDGDGRDDLATYRDDQFFLDFASNGFGQLDAWFSFGFIGVRERPVAADMDKDGIDDLGLFVPDRSGAAPQAMAEWYFLISADRRIQDRIHPDTLNGLGNVVDFSPIPLGKDLVARFGNDYAMPIVGNFDPPVAGQGAPVLFDEGLLPPPAPITVGLYAPGAAQFHLADENAAGASQNSFAFPVSVRGGLPVSGDWNGDGVETAGVFDPFTTTFHLIDGNSQSPGPVNTFSWGVNLSGWLPVAVDWDGDGDDTVGLFDPFTTTFYLINNNSALDPQLVPVFSWGVNLNGWRPVAGDWNGDGLDTVGVFDPLTATFYLINNNSSSDPQAIAPFSYRANVAGWWPVAGDWNGDGVDTIGLYAPPLHRFYLVDENRAPSPGLPLAVNQFDSSVSVAGAIPVAGRWTGPAPLLAAAVAAAAQPATVSRWQLDAIVDAALARWSAAGLPADRLRALSQVDVRLADLPGRQLGLAARDAVYLDWDAAGHGWFVDPTPGADEEFAPAGADRRAIDPRAVDRIDLVSVVAHELGHMLGLEDLAADAGLMGGTLGTGIRRTPSSREVEVALSVLDQ
ncbi:MAG: DUF4394 domain-containing protein, partial [Thermoguttaceae bacterium]|nr:DUF4394 domain-containing protein [Thermoguttaceae bacterium]